MRAMVSALVFALVGLTSLVAVANDGSAASGDAQSDGEAGRA